MRVLAGLLLLFTMTQAVQAARRSLLGCWLAWSVDPSFSCTYPPASGDCASLSLPVTAGEVYYAMVNVDGECASSDAEYKLSFDLPADPGAKLVVTDETYWAFERVQSQGTFHIP